MDAEGTEDGSPEGTLPSVYTVSDLAHQFKCSGWFIKAEVKRGNLPARRVGRLIRFTTDDVHRWIEAES